ncbi:error-prone DNA polymerase [Corynebacterium sp. TAE3-ERU12]|uniref:error-prone DNA polymerase n=1 Tax=Corynebacterium sp. TAE3-ERU12 TaxID=2849491 RepID=UPI001C442929|nr:error-prone DNA polymerase [Corynebacterium sp. TAE3-ERU12]MBV7294741.1 error-prone DNA polymerase [Corynebacterium sp. TAE3-ERU12]
MGGDTPHSNDAGPLSWSRIERILSGRAVGTIAPGYGVNGMRSNHQRRPLTVVEPPAERGKSQSAQHCAVELHCRSSYSFLHGAADPVDLVAEAVRLGLRAVGIADRDGFYGVARFAEAAAEAGIATLIGAELSLPQAPLTVLARGPEGYRRLSQAITAAHLAHRDKDRVDYPPLAELGAAAGGQWCVLADVAWLPQLTELIDAFGAEHVVLEHRIRLEPADADAAEQLTAAATRHGVRLVVSSAATCASPAQARLAAAKHALHERESLDTHACALPPVGGTWLRSPEELAQCAGHIPGALENTAELARECAFTLDLIAPQLPAWDVPDGHDESSWLRHLTYAGAQRRYGARAQAPAAWEQLDRELGIIDQLGFPGYFLIVHDICEFCRSTNILAQGRGSAANSAVCFALGITNVEPIAAGLLFERFLSAERDGPPDIDLDIESGRREEVIQYCYRRYGRDNAAQVANVITYRRRGALRDAARALGHPPGLVDAWVHGIAEPPADVAQLADGFRGQPRHLGIHSGGMVICDRAIADVVPVEWARMADRSVVQWDKDDCAAAGLVKFDLLGLGMLEAIHHCMDLVATHRGREIELHTIDISEPEVYAMLARADAVGVFQVESRAQMATLPRLRPREFFDLVVQVALIRPGPIQGGSVHPYIRRRNGLDPVTFDHPVLKKSLGKTLGIPLFQEQLMQIAVDAAGFTGAEADALRRAMGSKRSKERMEQLHTRFLQGLRDTNGITGDVGDRLWDKIVAFAAYGFPESHAQSFASLVYFSAWFKYHYPAEFCTALLRAQPMGFYSAQSLVADARRHGVGCDGASINDSLVVADCPNGRIRLGLSSVRGLSKEAAQRIVTARDSDGGGPYTSPADLARRADLGVKHLEALAHAGAMECLGLDRRQALWAAGVAATENAGMLPGLTVATAPALPGMSEFELAAANLSGLGVTPDEYPVAALRGELAAAGVVPAAELNTLPDCSHVWVGGVVTHRQRPGTAEGTIFLGVEDETGLMNVLCSPGLWERYRVTATTERALAIRGVAQNASGAVTIIADKLIPLREMVSSPVVAGKSRDFR